MGRIIRRRPRPWSRARRVRPIERRRAGRPHSLPELLPCVFAAGDLLLSSCLFLLVQRLHLQCVRLLLAQLLRVTNPIGLDLCRVASPRVIFPLPSLLVPPLLLATLLLLSLLLLPLFLLPPSLLVVVTAHGSHSTVRQLNQ